MISIDDLIRRDGREPGGKYTGWRVNWQGMKVFRYPVSLHPISWRRVGNRIDVKWAIR